MSRSSRHKEKHRKNGELSYENEGTAARTRPFAYNEIMLSRKSKNLSENVKKETLEVAKSMADGMVEKASDHFESEKSHYRHHRDSSHSTKKLWSDVSVKENSRKKEENTPEERLDKRKSGQGHASETRMKVESRKDPSIKAMEKNNQQNYGREKCHEQTSNIRENEADRKRLKSLVVADAPRDESSRIPEKQNKRKHQNGDDQRNRDRQTSRKHDLRKGKNLEISDREEKKELPKLQNHGRRDKRRRSRSPDLRKDRDRKSSLLSREQKATSYHQREHMKLSSHAFGDTSGIHHSDDDRNRTAGNGSSSHSRRHSGSRSGLGGYSPRKRRAEASVKTPSPLNHSPEKKSAKWDLAPSGTGSVLSVPVSSSFQSAVQIASSMINEAALTIVKPLTGLSFRAPPTKQNSTIDSVQLTESTRPMRRLYVENVPDSLSEKYLMESLNNYLLSSGFNHIHGSKPCISCIKHKEKGQALVEFLTPEDASSALSFDGHSFAGSVLKIRRPKDFVEVTTGKLEKTEVAVDALSDTVKDSSNKIFIGGISKALSSEMLLDIVTVFGPLKAYRFVINEDIGEPCAFLEYGDQSITLKACAGLNGMKLGGNVITAVQAFPDASSLAENGENPPFYGIPEHAKPLLHKPTCVIKLKNVLDPEGFQSLSKSELEEILEDVRLECARFGTVKSINVVKDQVISSTTLEAYAVDNPKTASSDETMTETDVSDFPNNHSEEINTEIPGSNIENEKADNTKDGNWSDDRPGVDHGEDELSQPSLSVATSEAIFEEDIEAKMEPHHGDEDFEGYIENQTAGNELNSDSVTRNSEENVVGSEGYVTRQSNPIEKVDYQGQERNFEHAFEPGCVFVEFGRIEASRMAAYSLHGRLFDNRVVMVEYVPLDHYRARFTK